MQQFFVQYGFVEHSRQSKRITGYLIFSAKFDNETKIKIRHLIIEAFLSWVDGRNPTKQGNIIHASKNERHIEIPSDY